VSDLQEDIYGLDWFLPSVYLVFIWDNGSCKKAEYHISCMLSYYVTKCRIVQANEDY
jgi:hypothetical protein